ncbi:MAG: arginine--tRNA ligase [Proteobacteria bacterium]|nr:arginine--tRNA ligase [Pseudomonadota bacterium]
MNSLTEKLTSIVGGAFGACGLPQERGFVRVSDRPDLAQFQCNGAMAAAKQAKKNPREVAQAVVDVLKSDKTFSKLEIAGPGFINLNITDEYLAAHMAETAKDDKLGIATAEKPATIILDYGGPNVAKAMHVGHLRTGIIGESVRRILRFAGYDAKGDVHLGDWGTPMGMLLADPEVYARAGNVDLDDSEAVRDFVDFLGTAYPRAAAAFKENPEIQALAQQKTVLIQNREPEHYRRWKIMRDASVEVIEKNFAALDVSFDLWKGESDVHDLIAPMVGDLKKKHFAVEDDGAIVVPVKRDDDTKEIPPLILYKRDGAVMYGTTDLATILERVRDFGVSRILYFVDQRQSLHFEQVFRAAHITGIAPAGVELVHAGNGTMNGPDGKPFKTRAGGVMRLEDMLAMGVEKARARMEEADLASDFSAAEKEDIARKVAIAAIKFADLQNQRTSDYIFDFDRMTAFEGKTGPYLLYQAVRIKSLLRKACYEPASSPLTIHDEDRPLILLLTQFPDAFAAALNNYAPHHLADYAYKLAQEFSRFYASCHILSEANAAVKESRLALCALTVRTLETALGLLGIAVPERM